MDPRLYREQPQLELEMVPIIPHAEVQAALEKGRVDLVVYTVGQMAGIWPNARRVCDVPTVMIAPPGTRARLDAGETRIDDLQFILPATHSLSEHWIEQQLLSLGYRLRQRTIYIDFPDVIQDMVEKGLGVSVLMHEQVADSIGAGRLEIIGPVFPAMQRVMARSSLAGSASRLVEDYLVRAFNDPAGRKR